MTIAFSTYWKQNLEALSAISSLAKMLSTEAELEPGGSITPDLLLGTQASSGMSAVMEAL